MSPNDTKVTIMDSKAIIDWVAKFVQKNGTWNLPIDIKVLVEALSKSGLENARSADLQFSVDHSVLSPEVRTNLSHFQQMSAEALHAYKIIVTELSSVKGPNR